MFLQKNIPKDPAKKLLYEQRQAVKAGRKILRNEKRLARKTAKQERKFNRRAERVYRQQAKQLKSNISSGVNPTISSTATTVAIPETTQSKTLGEIGTSINDVLGKTKGLENLTAEKLGKGVRSISSLGLVGGLAMGAFGYGGGTLAQLGGGGLGAEVGLKAGAHYGIVGAGVGAAAGLIGGMMAGSYAHRAVSDMGNSYRFNGMKRLAY